MNRTKNTSEQQEQEQEVVRQRINLYIYDTTISTMVPRDEEPDYREAGTLVNERLNSYFKHYQGLKPDKEIMYYTLIDLALRLVREEKRNDAEGLVNMMKELTEEIKEATKG